MEQEGKQANKTKKQPNPKGLQKGSSGVQVDQNPDCVQGTNDDSVLSKRSASRLRYFEDEFLRPFAAKPPRRSPLINRGYYIRCKVIRDALAHFLTGVTCTGKKQILSLGAGCVTGTRGGCMLTLRFDTSYWVLKQAGRLHSDAHHYYEADFDKVVARKYQYMHQDQLLKAQLGEPIAVSGLAPFEFHSADYSLLFADLRDLAALHEKLCAIGFDFSLPTLVLTECVMTYMNPHESNRIITWASRAIPRCIFVVYEQIVPNDAFGRVMRHRLEQRQSPLLGIATYPTLAHQRQRYLDLGFRHVHLSTLLEYFLNLPAEEVARVEAIEEFDEHEEWVVKCQHYFIGFSVNDSLSELQSIASILPCDRIGALSLKHDHTCDGRYSSEVKSDGASAVTASDRADAFLAVNIGPTVDNARLIASDYESFDDTSNTNASSATVNHATSSLVDVAQQKDLATQFAAQHAIATQRYGHTTSHFASPNGEDQLVVFGGESRNRLEDVQILTIAKKADEPATAPTSLHWFSPTVSGFPVGKRTHHASVTWDDSLVVIGGRSSPLKPIGDVCALDLSTCAWTKWELNFEEGCSESTLARWRHTANLVPDGCCRGLILVVGGRGVESEVAREKHVHKAQRRLFVDYDDAILIDPASRIVRRLAVTGQGPAKRFSHTTTAIGNGRFVVLGGMDSRRQFFSDAFVLELTSPQTASWTPLGAFPFPIFSHATVALRLNERLEIVAQPDLQAAPSVGVTHLMVTGGCSLLCRNQVFLFSLRDAVWSSLALNFCSLDAESTRAEMEKKSTSTSTATTDASAFSLDSQLMLARHTANLVNDRLYLVGGGGMCFSFGVHFNSLSILSFDPITPLQYIWTGTLTASLSSNGAIQASPPNNNAKKSVKQPVTERLRDRRANIGRKGAVSPLPIFERPDEESLRAIVLRSRPCIVRGLGSEMGCCLEVWRDKEQLAQRCKGKLVSVREFNEANIDFQNKNYEFRTIPFEELVDIVFVPPRSGTESPNNASNPLGPNENLVAQASTSTLKSEEAKPLRYYFRSIGENARKEVANLAKSYPELARDFALPSAMQALVGANLFSSILRVSSCDVRVWTHYDIMDNFLFQIVGEKQVTLWAPEELPNLYVTDSTSAVLDIDRPDLVRFPRFAQASRDVGTLLPGDALFIPALWFHNTCTLAPSISVNQFFKSLTLDHQLYQKKDLYGNRDLVPGEKAIEAVNKACQSLLATLPDRKFSDFYLRKMQETIETYLQEEQQSRKLGEKDNV